MRTPVTLVPDVAEKLKDLAQQRQASFKAALNEVLRRGLAVPAAAEVRSVVQPHHGGFVPGIDPHKLNQIVDDLEAEDFVDEAAS